MACLFTFEYGVFTETPYMMIDLGFMHSGKKAISYGVLENMLPEKNAKMNIKIGWQTFANQNLQNNMV